TGAARAGCLPGVWGGGGGRGAPAVLAGGAPGGVDPAVHDRILGPARKMAERDLPVAIAQAWPLGASTVSASLALAAAAGVRVFATGGIGGVHRGVEVTGDVSADLDAIATHPVVTVCAGAKAFLDLPRTLEHLETAGVPVLGWRHDWFPAFYTRSSGLPVAHRVEGAAEVAAVLALHPRNGGVLLTAPIPRDAELDPDALGASLDVAVAAAEADGVTGAAVTPFVLGRIAAATAGRSIPANLALAENNARIAADVAVAVAAGGPVRASSGSGSR
ncbi:MAG: pseudouridine-5'-phosphate glycosidase, partial [Ilumatobacteraceae bacterium]